MASRGNTTIAKMQLFHHLKQIYPEIPDEVVTDTMKKFGNETVKCMDYLKKESHSYRYGNHRGSISEQSSLVQQPTAIPVNSTSGPSVPSYFPNTYSRTSNMMSPAIYTSPAVPHSSAAYAPTGALVPTNRTIAPAGPIVATNQVGLPSSSNVHLGGQRSAPVVSAPGDYFDMPRPHQRWHSGSDYARSPSNPTVSSNASRVNFQTCDMVHSETRYDPHRNEYYNVYNLQNQKGAHYHSPNFGSSPVSASNHSSQVPRYKTQLNMEPVGPQATNFGMWEPSKQQDRPQQPQGAFTSVSLQLRAPSGGPNVMGPSMNYSTSSHNSDQGYQSQVKVEIGPNGGSIQAVRRHLATPGTPPPPPANASLSIHYRAGRIEGQPPSVSQRCTVNPRPSSWYMADQRNATPEMRGMERKSSLPDITRGLSYIDSEDPGQLKDSRVPIQPMVINQVKRETEHSLSRRVFHEQNSLGLTQALLLEQRSRSEKMKKLLIRERDRLCSVRNECRKLNEELEERSHGRNANLPTFVQIQKLREDTRRLRLECERLTTEVDTHDVPLCETNLLFYKKEMESRTTTTTTTTSRTTRSRSMQERRTEGRHGREDRNNNPDEEDPRWSCTVCTFLNHPALDKCEECEMPRVVLEEDLRQNIHIQFSHHNFPSRKH